MNEPSITRIAGTEPLQVMIEHGKKLIKEKRLEEALEVFEQVVKKDPSSKSAHIVLGRVLLGLKRPSEALPYIEEGIRLDPSKAKPYLLMGRTAAVLKDYNKALEAMQNAIAINSKLDIAYVAIGSLLLRLDEKNETEAEKNFLLALRLNPRMVEARRRLATILGQTKRYDEAIEHLNVALRVKPDHADCLTSLGRVYLEKKEFKTARDTFRKVVQMENEEVPVNALMGLADACLQSNELKEAERSLEQIPEKEQGKARVHKLWGDLYTAQGQPKQALEEYRAAELLASEEDMEENEDIMSKLPGIEDDAGWEEVLSSARDAVVSAMTRRQKRR